MLDSTGAVIVEEGSSSSPKKRYSRCELLAWRHVDPEQQRNLWGEIYCSLGSTVTFSDSLLNSAPPKQATQSESRKQRARKKKESVIEGSLCLSKSPEMPENIGIGVTEEGLGKPPRTCYSRAELEAWRHIDPEQQESRWGEIYRSLGSTVALEFDGLLISARPKQAVQSETRKQRARKKKESVSEGGSPISSHTSGNEGTGSIEVETDPPKAQPCSGVDESCCRETSTHGVEPGHEECEEDGDDTEEEEYSIQRPAFQVEGEPDFESGPPQDGWEYLRRVRWEAAQIPKVKVAEIDANKLSEQTPYMPKIPEIQKCPEMLLPMKAWEDDFLQNFSELRMSFLRIEIAEFEICGGIHLSPVSSTRGPTIHSQPNQPSDLPTLSRILLTSAVSRASMLIKLIEEFQSEDKLSRETCLWLFALCAVVDMPLYAELSASMRSLLRKCSSLLASRSDPNDEEVAMLNILVAITGKYFGQSEERRS